MATIDFYFDFSSPYGYFASTQIEAIAARHNRSVSWHPILLGAIFKLTGATPLPLIPMKGDYARRDFERCARLLKIPYTFPSIFHISGLIPSRAFYWISRNNSQQAKEFASLIYSAYFVEGIDISDIENIVPIAHKMGIDSASLAEGIQEPSIKEQLKQEVQNAIDKGVFGSPYFIIDGEPFHGADRLPQVDKWLETGGW